MKVYLKLQNYLVNSCAYCSSCFTSHSVASCSKASPEFESGHFAMASKTVGFFHDKKEINKLKDLESVLSGTIIIVFQPSLAESAECRKIPVSVYCLVVNKLCNLLFSIFVLFDTFLINSHK